MAERRKRRPSSTGHRHHRKHHVRRHHHSDQRTTAAAEACKDCGVVHTVHTVDARMARILDFALKVGACRRDQSTDVPVWAVAA